MAAAPLALFETPVMTGPAEGACPYKADPIARKIKEQTSKEQKKGARRPFMPNTHFIPVYLSPQNLLRSLDRV